MAFLSFENVGLSGLAAAVPSRIVNNYEYTEIFSKEEALEIIEKTGIKERRFTDEKTTSSDLCFAAAEKLISDLSLDRNEIELLIFVSQTPDYRMPATSVLLQHRLGLPNSTIAFDINMGCSGFIYGLSVVYAFMERSGIQKALLLDGETRSKVYSAKDRKTAFLFGDAGVAALIERDTRFGKSYFSLNSDGSRETLIKIDAGGYRKPSSCETVKERVVDEYGNIRSEEHGYMNGADVFNFVIREVPGDIKKTLEYAGVTKEEIDYFVFHQANSFMNSYLAKKMKLEDAKVPNCMEKFGNTSSVSVPLTMATQLQNKLTERKKVLLCGFGVGLTWATAISDFEICHISDLVEV